MTTAGSNNTGEYNQKSSRDCTIGSAKHLFVSRSMHIHISGAFHVASGSILFLFLFPCF